MKRYNHYPREDDDKLKSPKKPFKEKPAKNLKRSILEEIEEEDEIDYYKADDLSLEDFYEEDDEEFDIEDDFDEDDEDDEDEDVKYGDEEE